MSEDEKTGKKLDNLSYIRGLRVGCYYAPQVDAIQFWVWLQEFSTLKKYTTVLYVEEEATETTEAVWKPPTFQMSKDNARALMDDLWAAGIRPTGVGDHGETLSATKAHLDDMRSIAFSYMYGYQWQGETHKPLFPIKNDK